jgi:hypothetical protein
MPPKQSGYAMGFDYVVAEKLNQMTQVSTGQGQTTNNRPDRHPEPEG